MQHPRCQQQKNLEITDHLLLPPQVCITWNDHDQWQCQQTCRLLIELYIIFCALATEPGAQGSNVSSMYCSAAPAGPPAACPLALPPLPPPGGAPRRVTHTTMPQPQSVSPSRTRTCAHGAQGFRVNIVGFGYCQCLQLRKHRCGHST